MSRRASRVPLAWLNLRHDLRRLGVSLAGVGFAVVLMFTELGFLVALLDSTVAPLDLLDPGAADLVMISQKKGTLTDLQRFPRRWLLAAEAFASVAAARPLFLEGSSVWHNPATGRSQSIRVLACDTKDPAFRLPDGPRLYGRLEQPGTALFDEKSKSSFGYHLLTATPPGNDMEVVLARRTIRVVGTFAMGTDFANDGNVLVSPRTFEALFPQRRIADADVATVDVGLIRLKPQAEPAVVRQALEGALPPETYGVRILTLPDLRCKEQSFWLRHTPIGAIFILGMVLGFVVGVVICFQILASEIRDHLGEYATLKAMGYRDPFLWAVIFRQAIWLAIMGFLPGLVFSAVLYRGLESATGLPLKMQPGWVLVVLLLTLVMCIVSAQLAVRKLFSVDPAELFR